VVDDYRLKIYHRYASIMQDSEPFFNEEEARRWGRAYNYYFRGWLPKDKDASIGDLGCGTGRLLYFFTQRGYSNLIGVDISPEQVQIAKQILSNVYEGNILDFLESHLNAFDLITGLDIVEHFYKDEVLRFLDLCFRSLRSNGRLILQTPNGESPFGACVRYGDFSHEVCLNPNSLARILHLSGFKEVEVREQGPIPFGYSTVSTIRFAVWQAIRIGLKFWNIAETGESGNGVLTRVFLVSAIKV
jgi:SAM-dependent methyltransferase